MKNTKFVEVNTNKISEKSQPYIPYGFWFLKIFFLFFAFWLPWQLIKMSTGQKNHLSDRGLLKEHFCKFFVKISTMA